MNDLMPPPRRPLPSRDRDRIRDVLNNRAVTIDAPVRRSVTPWLAAATVAAIAVGGYGVATTLGGDGGSDDVIAPAGGTDMTSPPDSSPSPEHSTPPQGTPTGPSGSVPPVRSMAADEAYDRCITQVRQTPQEPPFDDPRGQVVASAAGVMTVVVSNGTRAWACNVLPDTALSHPVPDSPPRDVDAATFAFALTFAGNMGAGDGQLAWAGGVLPEGVSRLAYVFPDGHRQEAVVEDGYWVMQYLSEDDWARYIAKTDPVEVELTGPDGVQTVTVPLGPETVCNQVTHGC